MQTSSIVGNQVTIWSPSAINRQLIQFIETEYISSGLNTDLRNSFSPVPFTFLDKSVFISCSMLLILVFQDHTCPPTIVFTVRQVKPTKQQELLLPL